MATGRRETDLRLRIDLDAEPINGSLSAPGVSRAFSGWIGLAAALEAIRGELAQQPGPQSRAADGDPAAQK